MTNRPSVLRLITRLPVGGIERRLVAVVPRLAALGFPIRVCCLKEFGPLAEELRQAGIPVDLVEFSSRLSPKGIWRLQRHMREHRIQVVHAHMYRAAVPGTIAARLAKVPVVFSQVHNVDTWQDKRQLVMDRLTSRWRTGVFAVSEAVREDVIRNLRLDDRQAILLYNGVDTSRFAPNPASRAQAREKLGAEDGNFVFLVPARLTGQKNPIGVLEAFAKYCGVTPGSSRTRLWFAGNGPSRPELEAALAASPVASQVRLLGQRDDMADLYRAADCMVLSTFKEGFSNAVVESLACGTPVIAADVGGNAEAIRPGVEGWIHPAGDGDLLARQMAEAAALGDGIAKMQSACIARAAEFSLDALVERTAQLYMEAWERATRRTSH